MPLSAIGTWRYSKGIYRFHPELLKALAATSLDGDMPCETLYRLPEWSVYIETNCLFSYRQKPIYGFWMQVLYDFSSLDRSELLLVMDTAAGLEIESIFLGPWPLLEGLVRHEREAVAHYEKKSADARKVGSPPDGWYEQTLASLQPLISLGLYLCADEPEIIDPLTPLKKPAYAMRKKLKDVMNFYQRPHLVSGGWLGRLVSVWPTISELTTMVTEPAHGLTCAAPTGTAIGQAP